MGFWLGNLHEWLVQVVRVVNVAFQPEETLGGRSEGLRVSQTVCHVRKSLLVRSGYVELVSFVPVVVWVHWPVFQLSFPFFNVRESRVFRVINRVA
jgi:hypothetical protein